MRELPWLLIIGAFSLLDLVSMPQFVANLNVGALLCLPGLLNWGPIFMGYTEFVQMNW